MRQFVTLSLLCSGRAEIRRHLNVIDCRTVVGGSGDSLNVSGKSDARGSRVEANGASLYVEETGTGPSVVLLHGGLGSGRDWEHLIPRLARDFHVVTIDIRGHGRSNNPSGDLSYPLIAADVAQVIAKLELDRPFVVGWSDGGQHALQLGSHYPELAQGLLIGAADFRVTDETREWVREFFGLDDEGHVNLSVLDDNLGDSAPRYHAKHPGGGAQWRDVVEQTARLWLEYQGITDDEFQRIRVPALIMVGDRDEDVSVEDAVGMYRAIPNAALAVCPNADHFIPWREPNWLVATMRDFIRRVLDPELES